MFTIYRLGDAKEVIRRKRAIPPGTYAQVWGDVFEPEYHWVDEATKRVLDSLGSPLNPLLALDGEAIPIFALSQAPDPSMLPPEETLRLRTVAGHGIGVAWVASDRPGQPLTYEPSSPEEAFFFLRKTKADITHLWRLFRSREDAAWFVKQKRGSDPLALDWADLLPADNFEAFLRRHQAC